jgi:hypothetical protein
MALKDNATAPKTPAPPSPPNPNPNSLHAYALCVLVAMTTTLDRHTLHLVLLHQALHRHALHLVLKVKLSHLWKASSLKVGQWQVRAGKWEDASSLRRNLLFVSAERAAVMLPHLELGVAAWECRRWRLGDRLLLALQSPLWRLGVQALPLCSGNPNYLHLFETMSSSVGRKLSLEMRRSSPPRDDKVFWH